MQRITLLYLLSLACIPLLSSFLLPFGSQIALEAEAAVFHRQLFEELSRLTVSSRQPADAMAVGAVGASFKSLARALIVLTESGR